MMPISMKLKRDMASIAFPRHSEFIDILNNHAKLNKWIKNNPAPVFSERFALYDHIETEYLKNEVIQYLEFGVHRGASIKKWTEIHTNSQSRFSGFDTFSGLPTDWGKYLERGHFDTSGQVPDIADNRVEFHTGLFQQTLPYFVRNFKSEGRLVIHNDSDLYSSTLYTLTYLNDIIVPGTILIFDEFASPLHEFRAWNDYLAAYMRRATLIGSSGPYAEQAAFLFD